ncbi:MEKHLA domain protein [Cyanobacterium stanieri PCC 7202]|uniref:MEKHLA domain protein n=1 Tax=Cyanobacterium stanieri (strain ATCC 29140 / PCC 7202) TaxID=292563 RepID=K9YPA8_CYASC|nr:MEKHLA domain protein [Cyanobacterium stanieri PCC 7202]
MINIWENQQIINWSQIILNSYEKLLNKELIDRKGDQLTQAKNLFYAPMVVFSHNTLSDPFYNYGNEKGLILWDMSWEQLTKTPSRTTTEPLLREERERLLHETNTKGYVTDYQGVRISRTGTKYHIKDITMWNLFDDSDNYCGQAATFSQWEKL